MCTRSNNVETIFYASDNTCHQEIDSHTRYSKRHKRIQLGSGDMAPRPEGSNSSLNIADFGWRKSGQGGATVSLLLPSRGATVQHFSAKIAYIFRKF